MPVIARASVGNLQEATWLIPENCKDRPVAVYLATIPGSELQFKLQAIMIHHGKPILILVAVSSWQNGSLQKPGWNSR